MNRIIGLLLFIITTFISTAQTTGNYSTAETRHKKHANITIEAFDGNKFKGRMVRIAYDCIVLDASQYNPPAELQHYYLRPENDNYRIDLEYIKTVTITRGRQIGSQTLGGAAIGVGLIIISGLSFLSKDPFYDSFGEWAKGAAYSVEVGTIAGFFYGLIHRRRININGSYQRIKKLKEYYFQN